MYENNLISHVVWPTQFETVIHFSNHAQVFKSDPDNAGRFITSGLWSVSRHPNYFGEMVMWFGIWITCSSTMRGLEFLTVLSPCFVAFLIAKVSGIPILERMAEKRWGEEVAYCAYRDSTPLLVPFL